MSKITTIKTAIQEIEDFGPSNIALIVGVAFLLLIFAWSQKPFSLVGVADSPEKPPTYAGIVPVSNNLASGSVLGAVTYNPELVALFSDLEIVTLKDNSPRAIKAYSEQFQIVTTNNNLTELLAAASSEDIISRQQKLLNDLKQVPVPNELADYQRLSIGYYGLLFTRHSGVQNESLNSTIVSLEQALSTVRSAVQANAGVALP